MAVYGVNDIAVITSGGPVSWILINALRDEFGEFPVIEEDMDPQEIGVQRPPRGLSSAASALGEWLTKPRTDARIQSIIDDNGLKPEPEQDQLRLKTPHVNSERCRDLLQAIGPNVVLILSPNVATKETITCIEAPFLFYVSGHSVLTHERSKAMERSGAAIRLLLPTSNASPTLFDAQGAVSKQDNLQTYPWLLAAASREIVVQAVTDALAGKLAKTGASPLIGLGAPAAE